jgi:hypothetical protein
MPSSAIRTFTDPGDYAAAIRQGTYELTITERGNFSAKLIRIDLHRLWMQRFYDNLPRNLPHRRLGRAGSHRIPHPSWTELIVERCGNAADQYRAIQRGPELLSPLLGPGCIRQHVPADR